MSEYNNTESYEDWSRREKVPIQYRLYKGIKGKFGALRMNLKNPYVSRDPKKKEGVIFLEMAPTTGQPNDYDWINSKITIALSIPDIAKIILFLRNPTHESFSKTGSLKIMHDKGAGTYNKGQQVKTLEVSKPENMRNFMFGLYQKENETVTKVQVPVSTDEAIVISTLLQAAIPRILSWT